MKVAPPVPATVPVVRLLWNYLEYADQERKRKIYIYTYRQIDRKIDSVFTLEERG